MNSAQALFEQAGEESFSAKSSISAFNNSSSEDEEEEGTRNADG